MLTANHLQSLATIALFTERFHRLNYTLPSAILLTWEIILSRAQSCCACNSFRTDQSQRSTTALDDKNTHGRGVYVEKSGPFSIWSVVKSRNIYHCAPEFLAFGAPPTLPYLGIFLCMTAGVMPAVF